MKSVSNFFETPLIKCIFIFMTALALQIPSCMVTDLADERENASLAAKHEITSSYGGIQYVYAPVLQYVGQSMDKDGKIQEQIIEFKASNAEITGKADTETLHKSIYDVIVYSTSLDIKGEIAMPEDAATKRMAARIFLPMDNSAGIEDGITITINGKDFPFNLDDPSAISEHGVYFNLSSEDIRDWVKMEYSLCIRSKGAESLVFVPNASRYKVRLSSPHTSPGFSGDFLPDRREITENGFTAEWCVTSINSIGKYNADFRVNFIIPVNQYQRTTRTIKYSFLVILLIFAALFLSETLTKHRISIIQYIVTGLSLCMFYLMLLSVSEYVPFGLSYLIAAILTTAPLGGYFFGFMNRKAAISSTAAVALTYIIIYILLNMETYALLAGTALLFIILCAIMYFTRKSDLC
ncbi:MAG: cell envelope integrity protein CreD [Bacteroidales bacterium]|nr:cell envelope integrity protein CreD [Bacteroidales bacterium]